MSAYQQQYWNELVQLKFESEYLSELIAVDQAWERRHEVILALSASSAIGGWVLWSELGFLWAAGIAASQVLSAVRHLSPRRDRLRRLPGMRAELQRLLLAAERGWFDVAEGLADARQSHDMRLDLREKLADATDRWLAEMSLPRHQRLLARADRATDDYLALHYVRRI